MSLGSGRRPSWPLLGGVGLVLGLFLVLPVASLLWVSFSGSPSNLLGYLWKGDLLGLFGHLWHDATLRYYGEFFSTPRYYVGLVNGVLFSGMVTVGCCLVGSGLALILHRTAIPARGLLRTLALVPLALPSYLMALSFVMLFGKSGAITRGWMALTGSPYLLDPFTPLGCGLVQVFSFFPLVMLTTSAALERSDASFEEASATLGAPRLMTFVRISQHMLLPGMAAGAFLTFVRSFGDFATLTLLFPSSVRMIVVEAYRDMSGNTYWGGAATMSTLMVGVILILLACQKAFVEGNRYETQTGKGTARPKLLTHPGLCKALLAISLLIVGFPLLNLGVVLLLAVSSSWGTSLLPDGYTLDNFRTALVLKPQALLNSLELSGAALVLALALGGTVAYLTHRSRARGRQVLDFVTLLPFIIPGTAFATALITVFNEPPLALHLTVTLVVISYVITRSPYAVRSILASLQQIGPAMEESSATLGAPHGLTIAKVLLPLVRPGVVAGGIMIFISAMTDVALTLMICPPAWYPASLGVFTSIQESRYFVAAASGVVVMVAVFVPYAFLVGVMGVHEPEI